MPRDDEKINRRIDHQLAKATGKDPTMIRYVGNRILLELAIGRRLTANEADELENKLRRVKPVAYVVDVSDKSPVKDSLKTCIQE